MELEKKGIPTVTICTDAFEALAREEAKNLGMPDLPLAIIRHPMVHSDVRYLEISHP